MWTLGKPSIVWDMPENGLGPVAGVKGQNLFRDEAGPAAFSESGVEKLAQLGRWLPEVSGPQSLHGG